MNKVLFFDDWTSGWYTYSFLSEAYAAAGVEHFLVHIESHLRGSLPAGVESVLCGQKRCRRGGFECRDISLYGDDIVRCLEEENPDVVVMISHSHLSDRVMTRACQRMGIPIVFFMHGALLSEMQIGDYVRDFKRRTRFKVWYKVSKIRKFAWLFYQYYRASSDLWETLNLAQDFLRRPIEFVWQPRPHRSLNVDLALVYTQRDLQTVRDLNKLDGTRIVISGNPKLDPLLHYQPKISLDEVSRRLGVERSYVLALDEAAFESSLMTIAEQKDFLTWLKNQVEEAGLDLVIKAHPRSNLDRLRKLLGNTFIVVKDELDLHDLMSYATVVIGHNSSALIEALALRRPTLGMNWFNGTFGAGIFPSGNPASVREQEEFPARLRHALRSGWDQEELRRYFVVQEDMPAGEIIRRHIEALAEGRKLRT